MQLWPKIAKHFRMETGPNLRMDLVSIMSTPDKKELWAKTVKVSIVPLPGLLHKGKGNGLQCAFLQRKSCCQTATFLMQPGARQLKRLVQTFDDLHHWPTD